VLFAIILTFVFSVYSTNPKIGSVSKMHELLTAAAATAPVPGNAKGSYLTMRSKNGLIFGVINIIGNFATVFQDQAYWQRAIASRPATTVKAYLLGGVAWFAIPFTFATTLGLAAVALRGPDMIILTPADVSAGLPAAAAASALLGKSGAAALLVLLFLAVTSACSAELIAVSSIITYDIYKTYINPKATEEQILRVGHAAVALYAVICGLAGLIFFYIGVSLGWLYTFMGVILGSAVVPIALAVTWNKANKWGCVWGAVTGFFAGITAWLVTTTTLNDGVINVVTTGGNFEMLAGNIASIGVGAIIATTSSLIWPANFDWGATRSINSPVSTSEKTHEETHEEKIDPDSDKNQDVVSVKGSVAGDSDDIIEDELDHVALKKAFKFATTSSVTLFVILILLIPLPLFFSQHVYDVADLTGWVAIGIAWTFLSAISVVLYPLWESRQALFQVASGIYKDLFTKGSGKYVKTSSPTSAA